MFLAVFELPDVFDVLFGHGLPAFTVRLVIVPLAFVVVDVLVVETPSALQFALPDVA